MSLKNFTGYKCVACGKEYGIENFRYICGSCKNNLLLVMDINKIKKNFNRSVFSNNRNYSIWRYLDLLPIDTRDSLIPLQIGWTPLYKINSSDKKIGLKNLYIKDDGRNPSASFKDRAGAVALLNAIEQKSQIITGASTGNAASSMACLSASMGISPVIFLPKTAPVAKIAQLLVFGAKVFAVNGTYDDAFDLCLKATEKYGWYNRNTGYNSFTREGKKTCAFEIIEQLDWKAPDKVFVPVGDGNIISGIWKGFKDFFELGLIDRLPQLIAVQAEGSSAIADAVITGGDLKQVSAQTIADSISVDIPRDGLLAVKSIIESGGEAVKVSDDDILESIKDVARLSGVFGEPAGVTGYAGLKKMIGIGKIKPEDTIVVVITGNGLKDVASAQKAAGQPYHIEPSIDEFSEIYSKISKL